MHATIRRYEGVDQNRTDELSRKVNETLVPKLSKLPGFKGYFLIDDGKGIMSSFGLFETPTQADDSTRIVAGWVRDEKLDSALPNQPKITTGKVVAHSNGVRTVEPLAREVSSLGPRILELERLAAGRDHAAEAERRARDSHRRAPSGTIEARYAARLFGRSARSNSEPGLPLS